MIDRLKVFPIANYLENTLVVFISVLLGQGKYNRVLSADIPNADIQNVAKYVDDFETRLYTGHVY